jgi:hypothetical protein
MVRDRERSVGDGRERSLCVYTCCKPAGEGAPPVAVEGLRHRRRLRLLLRRHGPLGLALPPVGPPQRCHDARDAGQIKRGRQEAAAQAAGCEPPKNDLALKRPWCLVT